MLSQRMELQAQLNNESEKCRLLENEVVAIEVAKDGAEVEAMEQLARAGKLQSEVAQERERVRDLEACV